MELTATLRWLAYNAAHLFGANKSDFLVLTPPFMRRQRVWNRRSRQLTTFETRHSVDVSVLHQIFLEEHYRVDRLTRASDILRKYESIAAHSTPLIVDCGANIGLSAAYFSATFPRAKVIGIEPERENISQARKNSRWTKVDFIEAAVAADCGSGHVVDPGYGTWGFRVQNTENGNVPFVSMDHVLMRYADSTPFIAKVDIEGFESDLFARNTEWIDRFFLLIVELHDWMLPKQGTSHNFLKAIARRNRDFVHIGENIFSIANA